MRSTTIQTRIVALFVLLVVVIFSVTAFATAQAVASTIEGQFRTRIATLARFISRAGFPLTQGTLNSMGELLDIGLATVDGEYRINRTNLQPGLAGALPRALKAPAESGESATVFYLQVDGRDFYGAYAPVNRGPDRGLVLLYDAAQVRAVQWKAIWPILAAALAAISLANLSGAYIARSITRPLRILADSSARVAGGDLSTRISIKSGDEIEQLAETFNSMVESLRTSQEQLLHREKLATLGTVAAGIAHEIRNPLTSMKMAAEMLHAGKPGGSDRESIEVLLDEIDRLQLSTGALLDYAKPAAQAPGEAEIGRSVEEMLKLMRRQLTHRKIEVRKNLPGSPLKAGIAPDRIKQVLLNLILNAADAMPEGGRLEVSAGKEGNSIRVSVSDTGTGIPEEDTGKIFDPFYSTRPRGCGLGLAISKRFVEDAGGSISAASGQEGTTFTVSLPTV